MWQVKRFKTREAMAAWIDRHAGRVQFEELFIANGYAVEWRKLRWIG